jgi:hypothetical protein
MNATTKPIKPRARAGQELEECHLETSMSITSSIMGSSELIAEKVGCVAERGALVRRRQSRLAERSLTAPTCLVSARRAVLRTDGRLPEFSCRLQAGQPPAGLGAPCQDSGEHSAAAAAACPATGPATGPAGAGPGAPGHPVPPVPSGQLAAIESIGLAEPNRPEEFGE